MEGCPVGQQCVKEETQTGSDEQEVLEVQVRSCPPPTGGGVATGPEQHRANESERVSWRRDRNRTGCSETSKPTSRLPP